MNKRVLRVVAAGVFLMVFTGSHRAVFSQGIPSAEPMCAEGTERDPNVIFCDNFEDRTWLDTWSTSPYCCDSNADGIIAFEEREAVVCGARGFNDDCAAWTDEARNGNHYGDRLFADVGYDELYVRWYVYVSDPFRWDPIGDKNFKLHDGGEVGPYVTLNMWGTAKPHIIVYNNGSTPCVNQPVRNDYEEYPYCVNRIQNLGNDLTLQPGKWYLFEWYIKLNSPGLPDGVTKLWVDEAVPGLTTQTLRAAYTDVVFRTETQPGMMLRGLFLTPYHNTIGAFPTQHQKWDNIVISRAPIGPMRSLHEDFERTPTDGAGRLGGWDGPANPAAMYLTDQISRSGRRALELKYVLGSYGAGYMSKYFHAHERVYHRWYQMWSAGFHWDPVGTSMAVLGPVNGAPWFAARVPWGTGQLAITAGQIAEAGWDSTTFYQNQGPAISFQPERWYCVEVFVQLNQPGIPDGEVAAWIDGELKLRYTGRTFRGANPTDPASSTAKLQALMVNGGHYGTAVSQVQFSWHDDHATSPNRIGCR